MHQIKTTRWVVFFSEKRLGGLSKLGHVQQGTLVYTLLIDKTP